MPVEAIAKGLWTRTMLLAQAWPLNTFISLHNQLLVAMDSGCSAAETLLRSSAVIPYDCTVDSRIWVRVMQCLI